MAVDLNEKSATRHVRPSMNITPLVDVVLVLLIIFMVVSPMMSKQVYLHVPPKVDDATPPPPATEAPIVLTVAKDGAISVNGEVISKTDIAPRIVRMLNARADKVVFFDADSEMPYSRALEAIDHLRAEGIATIAVLADAVTPADAMSSLTEN